MSVNNITPPKDEEASSPPKYRHILDVTMYAWMIIYLIGSGLLTLVFRHFLLGFGFALVPSAFTIPVTFLTLFVYRKTRLSTRFELLVATLAGVMTLPFIFIWMFSE